MKTAITDKTLAYARFNPAHLPDSALKTYAESVLGCGADYIEVNVGTAGLLGDIDFSGSYILSIHQASDISYCIDHRFAYVVLPFFLVGSLDLIPEDQPVILEKYADEYSAHAVIMFLHRFTFIRRISAIRITGIFGESTADLVSWCKAKLYMPIDICPLNTTMSGTMSAIDAADAGASMLTLSFGRGYYYTALEEYLIGYNTTRRIMLDNKVIKAVCTASFLYTEIFGAIPAGLARMIDTETNLTAPVYDAETGMLFKPYRVLGGIRRPEKDDTVTRKIKSLGLELELESAVIEAIKKVDLDLYNVIKKGHEID